MALRSFHSIIQELYISSLVISLLGILLAIAMINVKNALDVWWELASIFSGSMLGLFLLGAFSRITKSAGALIGVIAGIIVILWLSLTPLIWGTQALASHVHSFLSIVFSTIAIIFVGFLASRLINRARKSTI